MKYLTVALAIALALMIPFLTNLRSEKIALAAKVFDLEAKAAQVAQATESRDSIDSKYTQELLDAQSENASLRASVNSGSKRLYIKATCPAVRSPAISPSLDDGGHAELDSTARQDYYDLRSRLTEKEAQLSGLQAYVNQVCLRKPPEAK